MLDLQSLNQEESSEIKFNQILFSSRVEEMEEKVEKTAKEIIKGETSGDKSKKDVTCKLKQIKEKYRDINVVGETSTSTNKSINKIIQDIEKSEKVEIGKISKVDKEETNKIENNNST